MASSRGGMSWVRIWPPQASDGIIEHERLPNQNPDAPVMVNGIKLEVGETRLRRSQALLIDIDDQIQHVLDAAAATAEGSFDQTFTIDYERGRDGPDSLISVDASQTVYRLLRDTVFTHNGSRLKRLDGGTIQGHLMDNCVCAVLSVSRADLGPHRVEALVDAIISTVQRVARNQRTINVITDIFAQKKRFANSHPKYGEAFTGLVHCAIFVKDYRLDIKHAYSIPPWISVMTKYSRQHYKVRIAGVPDPCNVCNEKYRTRHTTAECAQVCQGCGRRKHPGRPCNGPGQRQLDQVVPSRAQLEDPSYTQRRDQRPTQSGTTPRRSSPSLAATSSTRPSTYLRPGSQRPGSVSGTGSPSLAPEDAISTRAAEEDVMDTDDGTEDPPNWTTLSADTTTSPPTGGRNSDDVDDWLDEAMREIMYPPRPSQPRPASSVATDTTPVASVNPRTAALDGQSNSGSAQSAHAAAQIAKTTSQGAAQRLGKRTQRDADDADDADDAVMQDASSTYHDSGRGARSKRHCTPSVLGDDDLDGDDDRAEADDREEEDDLATEHDSI